MAVNVYVPSKAAPITHTTGDYVQVVDGHLHVLAHGERLSVAVYAPGSWTSARNDVAGSGEHAQ
jgi:hypothetical protein